MTTITLEVPDEVAARFKREPKVVSALLRKTLTAKLSDPRKPIHQELIDFLSSSPRLEQIMKFKISALAQERLETLLEKNREEQLTAKQKSELDQYLQYRHVLILLKARARRAIAARP